MLECAPAGEGQPDAGTPFRTSLRDPRQDGCARRTQPGPNGRSSGAGAGPANLGECARPQRLAGRTNRTDQGAHPPAQSWPCSDQHRSQAPEQTRLALVERQIKELDKEIAKCIAEDQSSERKRDILCSIPGLGQIAAAAILTFLPEIGTLDRKQAGSLAGLVPHSRESGQWKGKSFISGGRKPLRDALYMPALVAMRFNPDLKAKYTTLRDAGKPAKVAIVAIMRKLLETANALVKDNRHWVEKTPCS
jgi:transposase